MHSKVSVTVLTPYGGSCSYLPMFYVIKIIVVEVISHENTRLIRYKFFHPFMGLRENSLLWVWEKIFHPFNGFRVRLFDLITSTDSLNF